MNMQKALPGGRAFNGSDYLPGSMINTDSVVYYINRSDLKDQEKMMHSHDFSFFLFYKRKKRIPKTVYLEAQDYPSCAFLRIENI